MSWKEESDRLSTGWVLDIRGFNIQIQRRKDWWVSWVKPLLGHHALHSGADTQKEAKLEVMRDLRNELAVAIDQLDAEIAAVRKPDGLADEKG